MIINDIETKNIEFLETRNFSSEEIFLTTIASLSKSALIQKVYNKKIVISGDYNVSIQISLLWALGLRSRVYIKKHSHQMIEEVLLRIKDFIPIYEILEFLKNSAYTYNCDLIKKEVVIDSKWINSSRNRDIMTRFEKHNFSIIYFNHDDFNVQAQNIIVKRAGSYSLYLELYEQLIHDNRKFWLDITDDEWNHFYGFYYAINTEIIGNITNSILGIKASDIISVITSIQAIAKINYYKVYLVLDTLNNSKQLGSAHFDNEIFYIRIKKNELIEFIENKTHLNQFVIEKIVNMLLFSNENNNYMTHPLVLVHDDICYSMFIGDNFALSFEDLCRNVDLESYRKISTEVSNNLLQDIIHLISSYDNLVYNSEYEYKVKNDTLFEIDLIIKDKTTSKAIIFERKTLKLSPISGQKSIDKSMAKGDKQLKRIEDYLAINNIIHMDCVGSIQKDDVNFCLLTKFSTGNFELENSYPLIVHYELIKLIKDSNGRLDDIVEGIKIINNIKREAPSIAQLTWESYKFKFPSF